jgi:hypothetical protein
MLDAQLLCCRATCPMLPLSQIWVWNGWCCLLLARALGFKCNPGNSKALNNSFDG